MIPLEEAQAHVLAAVRMLPAVEYPLLDALGLVTAEDVVSDEAVPPFANSAMDGYAVRSADVASADEAAPVRLTVVGELPAGSAPSRAVGAGEAIRIMTGAPLPDGADAVVMVERTQTDGDGVLIGYAAAFGDHVRAAGGDVRVGDVVLPAGTVLGPAHLGVLASIGRATVVARRRPLVGVLSTGSELVGPGRPLVPGKIRESNRPMLLALAHQAGFEVLDLGTVDDDEDRITARVEEASSVCDALLTSGGVSVGDYDHVKAALDRLGEVRWFQLSIKPAKPFAFGLVQRCAVFGLPGNPVSSFVSFELLARPALRRMMGHEQPFRSRLLATAEEDLARRPDGKVHYDRVRLRFGDAGPLVARTGSQASNVLTATAAANALAVLPDGDGVRAGEAVEVLVLDGEGTATLV